MSSTTSKAAKVWAIAIIVMMVVSYSATAVALAVSMMTEEDTSVVRAEELNTTHEVLPKATMPEISIEELEAICVQYENNPYYDAPENTDLYIGSESDYTMSYKYHVQPGDTLWSIAEKFYDDGCFYPFIMKINDLTSENIQEGQEIVITEYFGTKSREEVLEECYKIITNSNKSNKTSKQTNSNAKNGSIPENYQYVGNYKITGYNPWCSHCCGKSDGVTASGTQAKVGRTIAAKGFSFGTKLYIEGYGVYVVEDTGGFASNTIDMAADSHEACYALTRSNVPVYVVN